MMLRQRPLMVLLACAFAAVLPMLTGCGYAIQGRVIRGPVAMVQVVDADDPRLTEANSSGGGAVVQSVLEPQTPTERQVLPRVVTDGQGRFSIPVDAFGSGILEYEAMLIARRPDHQGAIGTIPLPGSGKRVLITLPLGRDTLEVPKRFLDGAMRDAKPYLEQKP